MTSSEPGPLRVGLITPVYPTRAFPGLGPFVEGLARGLAEGGAPVDVIVPRPWGRGAGARSADDRARDRELGITVRAPRFVSFSNLRIGHRSTLPLSVASFTRAVRRALSGRVPAPALLYGHFLYPAGRAAARLAAERGVPSVVALGESDLGGYEPHVGRDAMAADLAAHAGVLSVSRENRDYCVARLGLDPARIVVLPNGVDLEVFRPLERRAMRARHGLPADAPIAAFLGHFIERKGPLRVARVLARVPGARGIFLGSGPQVPRGPQVLHAGPVPHAEVPEWLSAADVFVLPTRNEGSPNALLEAMACGLPAVSSDIPPVRETLGPDCGLLFEPDDVAGLASGVARILGDEALRRRMSEAALARARERSLDVRIARIRAWLDGVVGSA